MELDQLPLVSADSHVEEPSSLWRDGVPSRLRAALPAELGPDFHAASQFAQRIGVADFFEARAKQKAAEQAELAEKNREIKKALERQPSAVSARLTDEEETARLDVAARRRAEKEEEDRRLAATNREMRQRVASAAAAVDHTPRF